jgi:hypothetical protein
MTNTYRLALSLQARALQIIDAHHTGVHTVAHHLGNFTVLAATATAPPVPSSCTCGPAITMRGSCAQPKPPCPSVTAQSPAASPNSAPRTCVCTGGSCPPTTSTATPTHLTTGTLGSASEADKRDDGLRRG